MEETLNHWVRWLKDYCPVEEFMRVMDGGEPDCKGPGFIRRIRR